MICRLETRQTKIRRYTTADKVRGENEMKREETRIRFE